MADYHQQMSTALPLTDEEQKSAGAPIQGKLEDEHLNFLKTIRCLTESGEIDPYNPKSLLKEEVYSKLDQEWIDKTDMALINISRLLQKIYELYISKHTPDESPQYQTMIEDLWQMKQRIEEHHDVFKI